MIEPATVSMFIQRRDDLKYGWATDPEQKHAAVHARFIHKGEARLPVSSIQDLMLDGRTLKAWRACCVLTILNRYYS
jgi:hypothetical protein